MNRKLGFIFFGILQTISCPIVCMKGPARPIEPPKTAQEARNLQQNITDTFKKYDIAKGYDTDMLIQERLKARQLDEKIRQQQQELNKLSRQEKKEIVLETLETKEQQLRNEITQNQQLLQDTRTNISARQANKQMMELEQIDERIKSLEEQLATEKQYLKQNEQTKEEAKLLKEKMQFEPGLGIAGIEQVIKNRQKIINNLEGKITELNTLKQQMNVFQQESVQQLLVKELAKRYEPVRTKAKSLRTKPPLTPKETQEYIQKMRQSEEQEKFLQDLQILDVEITLENMLDAIDQLDRISKNAERFLTLLPTVERIQQGEVIVKTRREIMQDVKNTAEDIKSQLTDIIKQKQEQQAALWIEQSQFPELNKELTRLDTIINTIDLLLKKETF